MTWQQDSLPTLCRIINYETTICHSSLNFPLIFTGRMSTKPLCLNLPRVSSESAISRNSLVGQQVKDPLYSLQWIRSLPWCGFDLWPENFCMLPIMAWKEGGKKEERKEEEGRKFFHSISQSTNMCLCTDQLVYPGCWHRDQVDKQSPCPDTSCSRAGKHITPSIYSEVCWGLCGDAQGAMKEFTKDELRG